VISRITPNRFAASGRRSPRAPGYTIPNFG
jgi:hypothetical protein